MNATSFRSYVKQEYSEDFAKFMCEELLFMTPVTFEDIHDFQELETYIHRCNDKISDHLKSLFYYERTDDKKLEIRQTSLNMINKIRRDVYSLIEKRRKRKALGKKINSVYKNCS